MYIYIYILIYILIKEAIAFFAFFAFLSFAIIWFTEIYIVWSHTGNFFLFKVKKLSEATPSAPPYGRFFSFWCYKNNYLCGSHWPTPRTGNFCFLGIKNKLSGVFLRKQLLFCFFTLYKNLIYRDLYCVKPHGQFFSFWGYKNSYLCGCESHRRFLSFRNKKIIVWGDPPPPASRCFSQKAIAFFAFRNKKIVRGDSPPTRAFFSFWCYKNNYLCGSHHEQDARASRGSGVLYKFPTASGTL